MILLNSLQRYTLFVHQKRTVQFCYSFLIVLLFFLRFACYFKYYLYLCHKIEDYGL